MMIPPSDALRFTISVNFRNTEASVQRDGETVWHARFGQGGVDWIIDLMNYLRYSHNLLIGRLRAEQILLKIGAATQLEPPLKINVPGRDLSNGLPSVMELTSNQVYDAIHRHASSLVWQITQGFVEIEGAKEGQQRWPPQLPLDLITALAQSKHPIILTGEFGGLRGLDRLLRDSLNLPVVVGTDDQVGDQTTQLSF